MIKGISGGKERTNDRVTRGPECELDTGKDAFRKEEIKKYSAGPGPLKDAALPV